MNSNDDRVDCQSPGASNYEELDVAAEKTAVSIFHELCTAFNLGLPLYNLAEESGEAHQKIFKINLTVSSLGVSEIGEAKTKMQAKHNAAKKVMKQINQAAENSKSMHEITKETVLKCSEWLKDFIILSIEEDLTNLEMKNYAGILTEWALTRDEPLPDYKTVSAIGPPHNRKFVMMCQMKEHCTHGEGKSKKNAKNVAAGKMLEIIDPDFIGSTSRAGVQVEK